MIELLSNPLVDFVSRVVLPGLSVLVAIVAVVVLVFTLRRVGQTLTRSVIPQIECYLREKLGQERRESGGPWRSKNRPPEICLRKRSQEERFLGYRRDVHSGAICTRSARGLC